jgi:hypothetical protein
MVSYNTSLLDRHLAPSISEFTVCDAPDISAQHPEASHWLANHFLNSVFRGTFKNKYRQYAVNQIFRAQVAFADYHEARNLTTEFLINGKPDNPAIRIYFQAVARWESCLVNLQIFIDVMNKIKSDMEDEPVFKVNDGTPEQRAYEMANTVKHWGGTVSSNRHKEQDTIPLWLTNEGLKTRSHAITFHELASLVSEIASIANELQDPVSWAKPSKT